MALFDTKRTVVIDLQFTPRYSGFGGYSQWTMENMTPEQIDYFTERLDKLVAGCVKSFKLEGGFTGEN